MNVGGLSEHARVTVEALTERFEPLPGYTREECVPPEQSGLREAVRWQSRDRLEPGPPLRGGAPGPVRLRVGFRGLRPEDVRIYALYVEEVV